MTIMFISVLKKQALFCVLLISEITYVYSMDYCTLTCNDVKHTMCLYPKDVPGPNCADYQKRLITDVNKKLILTEHNKLRNKLAGGNENRGNPGPQPSASNMMQLEWDDEIAMIAQRWAYQCTFAHDGCRIVKDSSVGQNIAIHSHSDAFETHFDDAIVAWYDEVKDVNPEIIDGYKHTTAMIGHYTQLVNAKTRYVGCGHVFYKADPPTPYTSLFVCNYKPAGNILTLPVYEKGKPATDCPTDTKRSATWDNLCKFGANTGSIIQATKDPHWAAFLIISFLIIY